MKYFVVNEKSTANALNYLGFKYYKFTNRDGNEVYSFEWSDEFEIARRELWDLRTKYRK